MMHSVKKIRTYLKQSNRQAILISHDDAHRSAYLEDHDNYGQFITQFSGSTSFLIITLDDAALFVDGRYTIQAHQQLDPTIFSVQDYTRPCIKQWLIQFMHTNARILYNPKLMSIDTFNFFHTLCESQTWSLTPTDFQFIDTMWVDRAVPLPCEIIDHPIQFAGQTRDHKITQIVQWLHDQKLDGLLLNTGESIAWLFNIRSPKRNPTPIPKGYAYIEKNGLAHLFIADDQRRQDLSVIFSGPDNCKAIQIKLISDLDNFIAMQSEAITVAMDPKELSIYWLHHFQSHKITPQFVDNPCTHLKSIKNATEISGAKQAHIEDGVALCTTFHWIKNCIQSGQLITELDVSAQLLKHRQRGSPLFKSNSFEAIVGAGPHGAIIHYHPTPTTNGTLNDHAVVLIDSGGQYLTGTTDVTRTLYLGSIDPIPQLQHHYTMVLKGHIALAQQNFPEGTTGAHLDILARQHLWNCGLNYQHGTGHGVGSYLNVHEGPHSISGRSTHVTLKDGMILSNEPGYYLEGHYGIRLENLMVVVPSSYEGYLMFQPLTVAPFEPRLIDTTLLTADEITWLNNYHQHVLDTLSPHVTPDVRDWLKIMTQPLAPFYSQNKCLQVLYQ